MLPKKQWMEENYRWFLIVSSLALFPTKTLYNLPLIIMAILGLALVIKRRKEVTADPLIRLMWALFFCLWIPILLSLPDAVELKRAASTAVRYLGFPLVGIFVIYSLREKATCKKLIYASIAIVVFLSFDGVVQFLLGYDLFGNKSINGRLTSAFSGYRFSMVVTVMSPLLIWFVASRTVNLLWGGVIIFLFLVVLLAGGSRSAWIMFALIIFIYAIEYLRKNRCKIETKKALIVVVLGVSSIIFISNSDYVSKRIDQTSGLISTDFDTFDRATSYRLSIWLVSWEMFKANPVNGVGPRGFRYVYADYADKDNFWMKRPTIGTTHPHLMLMEVAAETGVIGLIGYVLFFIILIRYYFVSIKDYQSVSFPWLLSAVVSVFPLNSHMAIYSSFWGAVAWWLLVVALGLSSVKWSELK